jgi:tryptophan halogenase
LEVELDPQGRIAGLVTREHGTLSADLYVDCTGFRRQLITAAEPAQQFRSYGNSLYNDRAVAVHVGYDADSGMDAQMFPYVKAAALSAGWVWSIPLYNRLSMGYVYSSNFLSEDDAERELMAYAGPAAERLLRKLQIRFLTGKLPRVWAKNCVAIGLSGGFVEPLESSGLAITQTQIELLASMLDARYYDDFIVDRYNAYLEKMYTDIIEFITLHYVLTNREDSAYWAAVKHEAAVPAELRARLEVFERHLPTTGTRGLREAVWAFRDVSWFCVLLGMNFKFKVSDPGERALQEANRIAREKRQLVKELATKLPTHFQYLTNEVYGSSPREGARIHMPGQGLYPRAG